MFKSYTPVIRPLINEKSMNLVKSGFYTFEIDKNADKGDVLKFVEGKFKVGVVSVRVINIAPKLKLQISRKGNYRTSGIKKAIVRLKKGQKIAIFESAVAEESFDSAQDGKVEVKTAEGEIITKEKKSLLGGTKVKIEKEAEERIQRGQADLKTSHKETKKRGTK